MTELGALLTGTISLTDAITALSTQAAAGSTRLQVETGRLLGMLDATGVLAGLGDDPLDLIDALQPLRAAATRPVYVVIATAMGLAGTPLAAMAAGSAIGSLAQFQSLISYHDTFAAIQSADSTYGVTDGSNELLILLSIAARTNDSGLQFPVGQAIGGLLNRGLIGLGATIAAIDAAIGAPSTPSNLVALQNASEAVSLLLGVAQGAGFQVQVAIAAELQSLVTGSRITQNGAVTQDLVLGGIDQAIHAGALGAGPGFTVLVSLAANNAALVAPVTGEIASLTGSAFTADQALAALFVAAGAQDFSFTPAAMDAVISQIVISLATQNKVSVAQVVADIEAAATGTPTISGNHAIGVLLPVAAQAPDAASAQSYDTELASLLGRGIGVAALAPALLANVAAGTITPDQAVAVSAGILRPMSDSQALAFEVKLGAVLGQLVNNGLSVSQLVADVRAAGLDRSQEIGLLSVASSVLSPSVDGNAIANELVRLIDTSNGFNPLFPPTALFQAIETVTAAAGGNYDQGFGRLIASLAESTLTGFRGAVATELASLITRKLISDNQAKTYILSAITSGLPLDAGMLMLAKGVLARAVAGTGLAALVNNGTVGLPAVQSQLQAFVSAGSIGLTNEIELIAGMVIGLNAEADREALSAELRQFLENNVVSAGAIIADVTEAAGPLGSFPQALSLLLLEMAETPDTALQFDIGTQFGALVIAPGLVSVADALADIAALVANGQLTAAQAQLVILALTASGGPAVLAAVGQQFGAQLASQNNSGASDTLVTTLNSQLSAGQISLTQLAGILAAIGTAAYPAASGGSPIAAGIMAPSLINAGITSSQMGEFLRFVSFSPALLVGGISPYNLALNLNARVLSGELSAASANNSFRASISSSFSVFGNIWSLFGIGTNDVLSPFSDLGGFGPNTVFTILSQAVAAGSAGGTQNSLATLTSFTNSGALTAATQLAALVRNGQLSAVQIMSAVNAVAPYVDTARLVYLLARLAGVAALQSAASRQIAMLISEGKLTVTAALADIAAITNATPSNDSLVVSISQATAVSTLIGLYAGLVDSPAGAAVAQQLANIFTNPTAGYTQAAELAAINTAVSSNQITAAVATNLLLQLAVAAQLPPTSASFATIIADISSYIANNGLSVSSVVSTSLASVNSLPTAAATGALIGKIESSTQAIADITGASSLTPQREAAALLGLLPTVTAAAATTTVRNDLIALVTSHALSVQDLTAAMLAAGSSLSNVFAVLLGLAKADSGTIGDVGAAFASFVGSTFGSSSDPFFGGALKLSGIDFVKVMNGTMTNAAAIQDIESFNSLHSQSVDGGLSYLSRLYGVEGAIAKSW